ADAVSLPAGVQPPQEDGAVRRRFFLMSTFHTITPQIIVIANATQASRAIHHSFSRSRSAASDRITGSSVDSGTYLIATSCPARASMATGFPGQASAVCERPTRSVHVTSTDSMPEDLTTRAVVCVPWVSTS